MGAQTPWSTASSTTTTVRLEIDERACVRSGVCTSLAPHRFELTGDQAVIIDNTMDRETTGADADAVADAIACCSAGGSPTCSAAAGCSSSAPWSSGARPCPAPSPPPPGC